MPFTAQAAMRTTIPFGVTAALLVAIYGSAAWAKAPEVTQRPRHHDIAASLAQGQVVRPPGTEIPPPRSREAPNIGAGRDLPEVVRPPSVAKRPDDAPAIGAPPAPDAQAQPGGPQPPSTDDPPAGKPHQCVSGPPGAICN